MKTNLIFSILALVLFGCSRENSDSQPNPNTVNLAVGIKKEAKLNDVFNKLNALNLEIKQLDDFTFSYAAPNESVTELIKTLNQKEYIKNGDFKATSTNVYFDATSNKVRILTKFFNLNKNNQTDLLGLISKLNFLDENNNNKRLILEVSSDKVNYFKNKILENSDFKSVEVLNDDCFVLKQAKVLSANFPATVGVNQTILIPVNFEVHNGCGFFDNFDETISQNTRKIKLNAKYNTCTTCTEGFKPLMVNYSFRAETVGVHTIEFIQPDGTVLSYTINVQATNSSCFTIQQAPVLSASFPATGNVNQNISIPVTFEIHNACLSFDNFNVQSSGNLRTIKLNAKYDSCIICTQAVETRTVNYNFQAATAGVYNFKFLQPNGSELNYSLTIQ